MFRKLVATTPNWFALPIRLALGGILMGHGAQKVFGLWGGQGLKAFIENPAPYGWMRPAWLWMAAAAFAELVGGAMVVLGLLTRLGAFSLAFTMAIAILGVHWGQFFNTKAGAGFEYPLALFAMAFALLISGGGQASIDQKLASTRRR